MGRRFSTQQAERPMKHLSALIVVLFMLFSAGCAVEPRAPSEAAPGDFQTIQGLLQAAADTNNASLEAEYQLEAAKRLQNQGDYPSAGQLLASIEPDLLDQDTEGLYLWLKARGTVNRGAAKEAESLARQIPTNLPSRLPGAQRARAMKDLASLYELASRPLKTFRVLVQGYAFIDESEHPPHNQRIWEALKSLPDDRLSDAASRASDANAQGWLELALSLRATDRFAIEARAQAIRDWQQNWQSHPGARQLPNELAMIVTLPEQQPERIALTLPLSGRLSGPGQAVREGFLAAYYEDQRNSERKALSLTIHDTNQGGFGRIYADLLEVDPDLVIGPLRKESLAPLSSQPRMPIPVLALNYAPFEGPMPDQLYQFGLASEDEVRQIATRLHNEGHRNALVFAPASDWGSRMVGAFESAYETDGARMIRAVRFDEGENLNRVVADGFSIDQSRRRANELMRDTGTTMQYEPRRRQDIDAIVLLAAPEKARQFNPLFAFYYGGDLPVYGTSLLYRGTPDPSRDSDLDGIAFTDIPWVLDTEQTLRPQLGKLFPTLRARYDRLFALGVDSYYLASRLPVLEQVHGYRMKGRTGTLHMEANGAIRRHQIWARFEKGRPRIIDDAVRDPVNGNQ